MIFKPKFAFAAGPAQAQLSAGVLKSGMLNGRSTLYAVW
jgi:hypothetical protein